MTLPQKKKGNGSYKFQTFNQARFLTRLHLTQNQIFTLSRHLVTGNVSFPLGAGVNLTSFEATFANKRLKFAAL